MKTYKLQNNGGMTDFWKKYREYIVIVVFMAVFFGVVQFGIVTLFRRNLNTMNALQENLVDRKIFEEDSRQIPNMKVQAETIAAEMNQLDVLLSKDDVVRLAESLEALGSTLGVSVSMEAAPDSVIAAFLAVEKKLTAKSEETSSEGEGGVSSKGGDKSENMPHLLPALPSARTVFVTIKTTGKYPDTVRFLEKIDSMPTLLDILSVNIAPHEDSESSDTLPNRPVIFSGAPASNTTNVSAPTLSDSREMTLGIPHTDMVDGSFLAAVYLNQP